VSKAINDFLERMSEINPEALYPTDLKKAVVGMVERYGMPPLILVDKTMVGHFSKKGWHDPGRGPGILRLQCNRGLDGRRDPLFCNNERGFMNEGE
jgi:hypothetical protein